LEPLSLLRTKDAGSPSRFEHVIVSGVVPSGACRKTRTDNRRFWSLVRIPAKTRRLRKYPSGTDPGGLKHPTKVLTRPGLTRNLGAVAFEHDGVVPEPAEVGITLIRVSRDDVLTEHPKRSQSRHDAQEVGPEVRGIGPVDGAGAAPSRTRVSPGDEVDGIEDSGIKTGDVAMSPHIGPVSGEDHIALVVVLDLPADAEPGVFEAGIQGTTSAEEGTCFHPSGSELLNNGMSAPCLNFRGS
jgi:hypothetical protein